MIRVLVVDDDLLAAEAHAAYVERVDGFAVVAVAHSAGEAHAALTTVHPGAVDLVLLDLTLPDAHGLELARRLRAERVRVDIMAITAVRDLEAVQTAVSVGVTQYLIKPFGFPALRERLEQYRAFRDGLAGDAATTQGDVDALLAHLRPAGAAAPLPKGLTATTLDAVSSALRTAAQPRSASELAAALDLSRVTARRYLEHLAELGLARRSQRYGTPGRPEVAYAWAGARGD
ncbi:response regulator [Schumannella sp. 10F1B-5-1]|uniref:response regulator n=1 Tax=Schumannella sp. 10F1B-5-1 TaxID=2590780 RepID=UPI00113004FE|nr:response regulator [Schumannella sp. 10F1B-5-1]TPW70234.1 response regulator [Schumannella sp. 10F1B-5-1]